MDAQTLRRVHERARFEEALLARGVAVALPHRTVWGVAFGVNGPYVAVRDPFGAPRAAVVATSARSRALPGFRVLRLERVDPAVDQEAVVAGLACITSLARRPMSRVLRVHIELFSRDDTARREAGSALRAAGYVPAPDPRSYRETLFLDLAGDEAALLARLHPTGRRHVRAVQRAPVEVRPVVDAALAPRLDALLRETFARTSGSYHGNDWPTIIEFSRQNPHLSRIAGLFRTDADGPDALIAFAWGRHHGDHADYETGASTRPQDIRTPLGYATIWDLIQWAKRERATRFDFGGITRGSHGSADPLGGISDFKRYFGGEIVEVGEEWLLEPHPVAARLAARVSSAVRRLGRARTS